MTPQEADQALERDWLFQAMGEPLRERAAREIDWARELAARLSSQRSAPNLSAELRELAVLAQRLEALRDKTMARALVPQNGPLPAWIWYPEGKPAEDAPALARFFRCRFRPGPVRVARPGSNRSVSANTVRSRLHSGRTSSASVSWA